MSQSVCWCIKAIYWLLAAIVMVVGCWASGVFTFYESVRDQFLGIMARFGLSSIAALTVHAATSLAAAVNSGQCSSLAACGTTFGEGVSIINATFIAASGLNVSGTLNNVSFCRVFAEVAYGDNDTVGFEVWLPDGTQYNGRFLAVGTSNTYSRLVAASPLTISM
jgi:hypothetical protein